jgi:AcrR family transcriptional regulator
MDTEPGTDLGLRERKKHRTRQALAQAALRLFAERGFDATTVADIAAAADVAPRTFFSYFATKEDVVLGDSAEEFELAQQQLTARPPGEPVLHAMRRLTLAVVDRMRQQWDQELVRTQIITGTPAILARIRERWDAWEATLAAQLAAELGATPDDVEPYVAAAAVIGAFRAVVQVSILTQMRLDLPAVVNRAFDLLETELATYGIHPPTPPSPQSTSTNPSSTDAPATPQKR